MKAHSMKMQCTHTVDRPEPNLIFASCCGLQCFKAYDNLWSACQVTDVKFISGL